MDQASKLRSRSRLVTRRRSFSRPTLEQVEDRVQPGSLLSSLFGLPLETGLTPAFGAAEEVRADQEHVRLFLPGSTADSLALVHPDSPSTAAAPVIGGSVTAVAFEGGVSALPASWVQAGTSAPLPHLNGGSQAAALVFSAGTVRTGARTGDAVQHVVAQQPVSATNRLLNQVPLAVEDLATTALTLDATPVEVRQINIPVTTYRFENATGPDTSLVYSTFFGMDGEDASLAITVDGAGNAYATGYFGFGDDRDLFVGKVNTQGQLDWVSFFGAPGTDEGHGVAVDSTGNVYVTGFYTDDVGDQEAIYARFRGDGAVEYVAAFINPGADSGNSIRMEGDNFFLTGTLAGEASSGVLVGRFALDGSAVFAIALTISGSPLEGNGITTDPEGNSYVIGTRNEQGEDKEVLYFSLDGAAQLRYAYNLLHAGADAGLGITLHSTPVDMRILITGTFANETTGTDGFIGGAPAINGVLDDLVLITSDVGPVASNGIVTDAAGNAVITGALGITVDNEEAIIVKYIPNAGLDYYLMKGSGNDSGLGIWRAGNSAFVVGKTSSEDFPITEGAFQPVYGGGASDAWGGRFLLD